MTSGPQAFSRVAEEYERGRPAYPREAIELLRDELGLGPGSRVLDLGAGTGKLTRPLVETGTHVVAVEPLAALRGHLTAAEVLEGSAEAIPLPDASVDAAVAGDAWHWFDHERAAAEVARVVRPGGAVALLWQMPAEEPPPEWTARVWALIAPLLAGHPAFRDEQGRGALHRHDAFDGLRLQRVAFAWEPTPAAFVDYVASISVVASLPDAERERLLSEVAALTPENDLSLPWETRVWITRRSESAVA